MKDKILVYDDNCPLCAWYTQLFVRHNLLPANGRKAFSTLEPIYQNRIDANRSRNEIPLLDTSSGKVLYGIDALLEILGEKFGLIKTIGRIKPVNWALKKLYNFISYNRKVIVAKKCGPGAIDCIPDMNYFYRFLFMSVFLVFNTIMLFPLYDLVLSEYAGSGLSINKLQIAHFGLVTTNVAISLSLSRTKAFEYLGQVNMLALITILLLIPLLILAIEFKLPGWLVTTYLVATSLMIFKEYVRRMNYADVLLKNKWVVSINFVCISAFLLFVFR